VAVEELGIRRPCGHAVGIGLGVVGERAARPHGVAGRLHFLDRIEALCSEDRDAGGRYDDNGVKQGRLRFHWALRYWSITVPLRYGCHVSLIKQKPVTQPSACKLLHRAARQAPERPANRRVATAM